MFAYFINKRTFKFGFIDLEYNYCNLHCRIKNICFNSASYEFSVR